MIFELVRSIILPFPKVERFVPRSGKIIDIGCGHGVFSELLATSAPRREVQGIDPSKEKIKLAHKNRKKLPNLRFEVAYPNDVKRNSFDVATVLDVLYLLPKTDKLDFIKDVYRLLKPGGIFVLKETDNQNNLASHLVQFEEKLMVEIFKYTYTDHKGTYPTSKEEYIELLKSADFKVKKVEKIRGLLHYPHVLFVCEK